MAQAAATFSAPKKKIKVSAGRRVFVVFNYIFCFLVGMICLVPVLKCSGGVLQRHRRGGLRQGHALAH